MSLTRRSTRSTDGREEVLALVCQSPPTRPCTRSIARASAHAWRSVPFRVPAAPPSRGRVAPKGRWHLAAMRRVDPQAMSHYPWQERPPGMRRVDPQAMSHCPWRERPPGPPWRLPSCDRAMRPSWRSCEVAERTGRPRTGGRLLCNNGCALQCSNSNLNARLKGADAAAQRGPRAHLDINGRLRVRCHHARPCSLLRACMAAGLTTVTMNSTTPATESATV